MEVLDTATVQVRVRRRRGQRSLRLAVHPSGEVWVSCGLSVPRKALLSFVEDRQDWLNRVLARASQSRFTWTEDARILVLGQEHRLVVAASVACEAGVRTQGGDLIVTLPPTENRADLQLAVQTSVMRYFQHNGSRMLRSLVAEWAPRVGVSPSRLQIRGQRSRWGSCSRSGTISLNWKLLSAPFFVAEYVVVHELVHMIHFHHGRAFWSRVRSLCPRTAEATLWLRQNQIRIDSMWMAQ